MLEFPKSPLEWTQFLISQLIANGATATSRELLESHTDIDTDGTIVKTGTFVGGQLFAASVKDGTDSATETVWNWVGQKWTARKNRKNTDKE